MPAQLLAMMKTLVLCATLALTFCTGPSGESAAPPGPPLDGEVWDRLLELSLEHTPEARRLVQEIADRPPSPVEEKLARALLEEWDLAPTDETLRRPRLVHLPKVDWSDLPKSQGAPFMVPVKVTVDDRGLVEELVLLKETDRTAPWVRRALEQFSSARFRPARGKDGGYVRQTLQTVATPHPE
jgi:hypothetical protein